MPHSTYLPASSSSSSTSSFLYYGHSLTLRISNGLLPFIYTYLYIRVGCKFRSFVKGRSTIVNEIIKKKIVCGRAVAMLSMNMIPSHVC